jgi:hypothetical protein
LAILVGFPAVIARSVEPDANVEVTLTSEQAQYVLGEPVRLAVDVKNTGQDAIEFCKVQLDSAGTDISLVVSSMTALCFFETGGLRFCSAFSAFVGNAVPFLVVLVDGRE